MSKVSSALCRQCLYRVWTNAAAGIDVPRAGFCLLRCKMLSVNLQFHLCWASADFAELVRRSDPGPDVAASLVRCKVVSSGIAASKASGQNAGAKPRSYL